jgi:hypothetical protein
VVDLVGVDEVVAVDFVVDLMRVDDVVVVDFALPQAS